MTNVTFPLTIDEASHFLRQVVEDRGEDFTYEPEGGKWTECLYWHATENKPGCGVGDALFRAGVSAEVLQEADKVKVDLKCEISNEIHQNPVLKNYFDHEARNYVRQFQASQDAGHSWGESLEDAEEFREKIIEMHH